MQLKRFFAIDNHTALKQVREEIGPDAVIISNRKLDNGVEIIASAPYDESHIESALQNGVPEPENSNTIEKPPSFSSTLSAVTENNSIEDMRAELTHMRSMLDSQIAATQVSQWGQESEARAELFGKLSRIGLGIELITQLIAETDVSDDLETASRKVLVKLKNAVRLSETDLIEEEGVVVLHGPTGAGKTTTIAKLAARFLMKNESRDLVLVCADSTKVGAYEHLQTFGKLLGISVTRVRRPNELVSILGVLGEKKLVLIDSAGMGQADLRNPEQLFGMEDKAENVRHYLVLPATMQRAAMDRIYESLSECDIAGVILTKLDEAVHLGDVLTSLVRYQVPLCYWTDGQSITNDLCRADAAVLVSKAMHLSKTAEESKDDRILLSMIQPGGRANRIWQ